MTLAWIGDLFILMGAWGVGNRRRSAFLFTITGEILWIAEATQRKDRALAFLCTLFVLLATRSLLLWGRTAE